MVAERQNVKQASARKALKCKRDLEHQIFSNTVRKDELKEQDRDIEKRT